MSSSKMVLSAMMFSGFAGLVGCATDSDQYHQANPGAGSGSRAYGDNPERHGAYAAPDTGTTSNDRAPAGANDGGAK